MSIAGLTDNESTDLIMSVGTHQSKRRIGPVQVAQLLERASRFQSLESIASALSLRDATLPKKFVSLLALPEEIRSLVSWGSAPGFISFSSASEIARAKRNLTEEALLVLSCVVLEHGLSKTELQAIVQRISRGHVPLREAVQEILAMRPVVERQYVFMTSTPPAIRDSESVELGRIKARQHLASAIGARNLLSVSVTPKTLTFVVLGDSDGHPPPPLRGITSESLKQFVESVFIDRAAHPND
jgi:hypothetical protein